MALQTTRPMDPNDKWLVDDEGNIVGARCAGLSTDIVFGNVSAVTDPLTGGITGLVGPDGNFVRAIGGPRKAALLGDSIAASNMETVAGSVTAYRESGWLTWAQMRLGFPWDVQATDQYAVGGTTMDKMIAIQLPLLKAGHTLYNYDRCFISSGTNDSNAGDSIATMIDRATTLIGSIGAMGITPVHIGILPRATSGGMTDARRKNLRFNDWLANYAARTGNLEYIQGAHEAVANNADANGYILSTVSADALHPNGLGGFLIGEQLYNYYAGMGLPSSLQFAQSRADVWDAAYNPSGVCFDNPNPFMTGGSPPTGMLVSGGTNGAWAAGSRTLSNGETRPTMVWTNTGGAATSGYLYDDVADTGTGWAAADELAPGDKVYAQAIVEVTTGAAGVYPFLQLVENDGATPQNGYCVGGNLSTLPAFANGTLLTLRTPNVTVRDYSGSGTASVFAKILPVTGGNAGVLTVRAFELRKVVD